MRSTNITVEKRAKADLGDAIKNVFDDHSVVCFYLK